MKTFSSLFWKAGGSLAAILTVLAILIAVNVLCSRITLRKDLTAEKMYTLSPGTRNVLGKLDRDITLKFFFSGGSPEVAAPLKSFAQQVEDLLREYERASGGHIVLETYDPQPDSDAEEWAQRYGIPGQPIGPMGPNLYLGIVAVCGDQQAVLPVIDPRMEEMLEYNLTRLVYRVANPKRPVVGVLSSLPVLGSEPAPYMMPGQPRPTRQPPWIAFQELQQDYDVRRIPPGAPEIDPDIDALVVVHPKNLTMPTLYAIDQFVLRGGRLLAFVDPLCVADLKEEKSPQEGMGMPSGSSDLKVLFNAWGIEYDPGKVVADLDVSTTVRGRDGRPEQSPLYLSLAKSNVNAKDIMTASLESVMMPFAGAFGGSVKEGIQLTPLITSSKKSQLVNAMMAQFGAESINRDFQSGGKELNLAVRLTGTFPTAFPAGRPPAEGQARTDSATNGAAGSLTKSVKPGTVVLVGDVDLLYDSFCVQALNFFGSSVNQPINENITFFANAVEQLSGGADMIGIRSRGRTDRPFTRVLTLARQAQERWMAEEREISAKTEAVQERLNQLQAQKDPKQRYILSPEQAREIEQFRKELADNRIQLKNVRKNLREGIEHLGMQVKAINILLMPLLVAAAGIGFYLYRRAKSVSQ